MNVDNIISMIESHIAEMQEYEAQAREAHDYPMCLMLYGGIIHMRKLLKDIKEGEETCKKEKP